MASSSLVVSTRPTSCRGDVTDVVTAWRQRYGTGSVAELCDAWTSRTNDVSLEGAINGGDDDGVHARLASDVERAHQQRWGSAALAAEKLDELARDRARGSDRELCDYQAHWERRIERLTRRYPERFFTPGLSFEELRDSLTLALLDAVRHPQGDRQYTLPGKEWGLLVITSRLRELRRRFRLNAEPTDFREVTPLERSESAEDRWVELESEENRKWAAAAAEGRLSASERQWYAALRQTARGGEFFATSQRPNLSAASRLLGRDRASAHRAYREIQARFRAELRSRE